MKGIPKSLKPASVVGVFAALTVAVAQGAIVEVGPLILRANGRFSPSTLPEKKFAPTEIQAAAAFERKGGGVPPALEHAVLDLGRNVRLSVGALAECPAERVAEATPEQARALCRGAIVGRGSVDGLATVPGQGVIPFDSALTIFNGPRLQGKPTAILHAQFTTPALKTFALVVPIEKRRGRYRYRATVDLSSIAADVGSVTHINLRIGRRYVSSGIRRSYIAAHCTGGVLEMRGTFGFADKATVEGDVVEFCRIR